MSEDHSSTSIQIHRTGSIRINVGHSDDSRWRSQGGAESRATAGGAGDYRRSSRPRDRSTRGSRRRSSAGNVAGTASYANYASTDRLNVSDLASRSGVGAFPTPSTVRPPVAEFARPRTSLPTRDPARYTGDPRRMSISSIGGGGGPVGLRSSLSASSADPLQSSVGALRAELSQIRSQQDFQSALQEARSEVQAERDRSASFHASGVSSRGSARSPFRPPPQGIVFSSIAAHQRRNGSPGSASGAIERSHRLSQATQELLQRVRVRYLTLSSLLLRGLISLHNARKSH